jgi:hypothetical protein
MTEQVRVHRCRLTCLTVARGPQRQDTHVCSVRGCSHDLPRLLAADWPPFPAGGGDPTAWPQCAREGRRAAGRTVKSEWVGRALRSNNLRGVTDGDQVAVTPLGTRDPDVGDVVLVRCRGHEYLHLVKARQGDRFLSATTPAIFGVATQIEPWRAR